MKLLAKYTHELRAFVSKLQVLDVPENSIGGSFPKLTIITPSYNQGIYLERTILSVLNQNYPNLEYIIVDGGSTDESVSIIKKYEKYLTHWISEKDKGQVDALNKGIALATGDWIGFQNSDDVYFQGTFRSFAKMVLQSPKYDMLYGDLFMISQNDEVTELLKTNKYSFFCQLYEGMQIHNQSLFFRRTLIEKYGFFNDSYQFAFDYEFITRFTSNKNIKVAKVEGLKGALRNHPDTKSINIADIGKHEHKKVYNQYKSHLSINLPTQIAYLLCRIRKLYFLIVELDISYIIYRLSK